MELNGLLLVCKKLVNFSKFLNMHKENVFAHTDSLVALHWLTKDKSTLKLYVSSRVCKIQSTKITTLYTHGIQNPANMCRKPKPSKDYVNNKFWAQGLSYFEGEGNKWIEEYKL